MGEVSAEARKHTTEALGTLVGLMRASPKDEVRCRAAEAILDRGWGRPAMSLSVDLAAARVDLAQVSQAEWEALAVLRHAVRPALPPAAEAVVPAQVGNGLGTRSDPAALDAQTHVPQDSQEQARPRPRDSQSETGDGPP